MREVSVNSTYYMKPISLQSKALVVCSVTAAIFIDFCLKKLSVSSQHIGKKTHEYLNSAEQIPGNWNVDQLSVIITSWDITEWCNINLLWKELMERMSEHTCLISSYQLLITAACTNTGVKMKGSHSRAADRCPFVLGHILSQVTYFMQLGMLCYMICFKFLLLLSFWICFHWSEYFQRDPTKPHTLYIIPIICNPRINVLFPGRYASNFESIISKRIVENVALVLTVNFF